MGGGRSKTSLSDYIVQTHKCECMELDKDKHKQLANLKKHKDTVHKSRKCIQNVVLKIGNALLQLFALSEFDWIKCTRFQGKIGNLFKFQLLFFRIPLIKIFLIA